MACEFSAGGNLLEIFRVFDSLAKDCISMSCKHIENRPEKDGVLTVERRRFFPKKRRVSGAKTKSFESKDFVFLRKDGVFSALVAFLLCGRRRFARKSPQNRMKIPQTYLFCILILLLGKWGYCISDFVNRLSKTENCFLTVSGSER